MSRLANASAPRCFSCNALTARWFCRSHPCAPNAASPLPSKVDEPETLDERLAEEEPDDVPDWDQDNDADTSDTDGEDEVGGDRAGRLIAQNEGSGEDEDAELWATDAGIDGAGASAEEAAMHVIDDDDAADD